MQLSISGKQATVPDFLIVGAAKSGTTSVYYYLKQHPQVFLPAVKEPQYFSYCHSAQLKTIHPATGKDLPGIIRDTADYLRLFDEAMPGHTVGEASTGYLYDYTNVIRNLKAFYRDRAVALKIVVLLRNPIERAWSNYIMHKNTDYEPLDFMTATKDDIVMQRLAEGWPPGYDYIGFGRYAPQVQAWMESFKQTKVFLYDEFLGDPLSLIQELYEFLGVDRDFAPDIQTKYNTSGTPRNALARHVSRIVYQPNPLKSAFKHLIPSQAARYRLRTSLTGLFFKKTGMDASVRDHLRRIYLDDIKRLESLLTKDLGAWYRG